MDNRFELPLILAPIAADKPAGPDLRADYSPNALYGRLKDARTAARAAERRQESEAESGSMLPEWGLILQLAPEALAQQSKDLEIAVWLAEALLRARGLPGLADGFALLRGLCEGFWPQLNPPPDEDGLATTLAPLAVLNGTGGNGTLLAPLRRQKVTQGGDGSAFSLWQLEQAAELTTLDAERRARRIAAGAVTMEQVEASARATPAAFARALAAAVQRCGDEFAGLDACLTALAGSEAPPTSDIRELLQQMQRRVQALYGPAAETPRMEQPLAQAATEPSATGPAPPAFAPPAARSPEGFASREEALRALEGVSRYFRRTEPHSPISYTLDELVRRARLPFVELLAELLPDEQARRSLLSNAGIKGDQAA
jgi:type VI secretion system protein ImpA